MNVSKAFLNGMQFPSRIKRKNPAYDSLLNIDTVKDAWTNTGRNIKAAIETYDTKTKENTTKISG